MPTRNRRRFVGQSIWYSLRQNYSQRELIVLDDCEDAVADLVPNDERIRYVRLDRRLSLGAKRNLGCELSKGSLIAHWDVRAVACPLQDYRLRTRHAYGPRGGTHPRAVRRDTVHVPHSGHSVVAARVSRRHRGRDRACAGG